MEDAHATRRLRERWDGNSVANCGTSSQAALVPQLTTSVEHKVLVGGGGAQSELDGEMVVEQKFCECCPQPTQNGRGWRVGPETSMFSRC